ncbi:hypothetical protein BKI52_12450 [marine bacterium AO1-C]|nr:hypothetical protein BKI52_12450 [marine bacterium AO1-C]
MSKKTKKQIEIEINGKKANASLEDLGKLSAQLNKQLRKMKSNAAGFDAKSKSLQEVRERYKKLKDRVEGVDKANVKTTGGIGKLGSIAKMASGPLLALFSAQKVIEFGKEVATVANQLIELRREVEHAFKAQGSELDALTVQIQATSKALGTEKNTLIEAGKAIKTQFGGDMVANMDKVQQALSGVSKTQREEIISQMDEYASKAKDAGMNLDQMLGYLVQSSNMGIVSDKAMDALGEGMNSIRESTKATRDAMKNVGVDVVKMENDILNGTKTYWDAMQDVSKAVQKIPAESRQMGTVLADVFRGAGEDAGSLLVKNLHKMGKGLDAATDKTSKLYQENQRRLAQERELATVQNQIAKELTEGSKAAQGLTKQLQILAFKVALELITRFKEFFNSIKPGLNEFRKRIDSIAKQFGGWKKIFAGVASLIKDAFNNIIAKPAKAFWGIIVAIADRISKWKGLIRAVGALIKTNFKGLIGIAKTIARAFTDIAKVMQAIVNVNFKKAFSRIKQGFRNFGKGILNIGTTIQEGIGDMFNTKAAQRRHAKEALKIQKEEAAKRAIAAAKAAKEKAEKEARAEKAAAEQAAKDAKAREERKAQAAEARRLRFLENLKAHYENLHKLNDANLARELTALKAQFVHKKIDRDAHDKGVFEAQKKAAQKRMVLLKSQFGQTSKAYQDAYSAYLDIIKSRQNAIAAAKTKAHEKQLKTIQEGLKAELNELKKKQLDELITEKEYHQKFFSAKKVAMDKQLALIEQRSGKESTAYQNLYAQLLSLQEAEEKRLNSVKDKQSQERQKKLDDSYKNELAALNAKLDQGEISEREYYAQSEALLNTHWSKKLSVAAALYGQDSKQLNELLKQKLADEKAFGKKQRDAQRARAMEQLQDSFEITKEGADFALELINDSTDRKLAALEEEAARMNEFYEAEKEAANERYEAERELEAERYEAETELKNEKFEAEKERIQSEYQELRDMEQSNYDQKKLAGKIAYEDEKHRLEDELRLLKDNGKGKTAEAKAIEQQLRDLKFNYNRQKLLEDNAHKVKMKAMDKQAKAEEKAREKAHKAEMKARDQEHQASQKRSEELHKALLANLNKSQVDEEKKSKEESTRIKRDAHQKSKIFTIAQIGAQLGTEIAGYFAHPGSIASLGVLGGIKMGFAVARAGAQIAKVSSQQFGKGGYLQSAKMFAQGGRLYGGADGGMIVRGARHANGGIQLFDMQTQQFLPENIEGNEGIVSARRAADNPRTLDALIHSNANLDQMLFSPPSIDQSTIRRFASGGILGSTGNTNNIGSTSNILSTDNTDTTQNTDSLVVSAVNDLTHAISRLNENQEYLAEKMENLEAKIALDHYQDIQQKIDRLNRQTTV